MNFTVGEVKMFRLNSVAARRSDARVESGKGNFNTDLRMGVAVRLLEQIPLPFISIQ